MIRLPFSREPRPGDTIRGDLRIPDGPPPRAAVLVAHGFKGYKDWGFFPWVAEQLAGAGYAVVSFNFSHSGIGSDPDGISDLDRFASNTVSLEREDLRFVLSETLEGDLLPRRPKRAALLGHGRGGGHAVLAAASERGVGALVTWAAVSHFDRWTEETKALWRAQGRVWVLNQRTGAQMPVGVGLLEDFEAHREALDVAHAAACVGCPWLILHGTEDLTVWPGEAEALARANPAARLHRVHGADHTFETAHPFAGATPQLREAIDRTLEHLHRHLQP